MINKKIKYYNDEGENFAEVCINEQLTFTCRVGGMKNNGDMVILLHGFPETSRMWYDLIKILSINNYRVVAPDQRGYSRGARPLKVSDYKINKLTQDVINLADAFNTNRFHLIGHDWGAAVGWVLSSTNKDKIISYSALSVPHLDAFSDAISNNRIQKKKSYYMKLFRIKYLAEFYFKIFNYHNLKTLWRSSKKKEIESYLSVFSQKNALQATLNWYRATNLKSTRKIGNIFIPVLMIYGKRDIAIAEKAVDETINHIKAPYTLKKINSTHWIIQDSFDLVSNYLLNHLESNQ